MNLTPPILRPYQDEALLAVTEAFRHHASALVVMATGLGKTVLLARLAADWPTGRVLVIAHREELITQAHGKLTELLGDAVAVEMAQRRADFSFMPPKAVVASIQTLSQPERLKRFNPQDFGLIIIDEAHHAVARSYLGVLDWFATNPESRRLGVTATPRRADNFALGQVFSHVAYDYGIEAAIEDGWLVPVRQKAIHVVGLDFSKVRTTAGDLNERDLEDICTQEEPLHKVVSSTVEITADLPTLIFAVTVRHAKMLSDLIEDRYKPHSSAWLSGATDKQVRRDTVARFKDGGLQYLVNCGLFLEGFDAPRTACVVMARPTKSLPLFCQVLGRGTRPLPGTVDGVETATLRRRAIAESAKPTMLVIDFVGNSGRHKIVTAADVLGGKYGTPVRDYAKKTAEEETALNRQPMLIGDALQRASDELALLAEIEERRRRASVKARAQYIAEEVSPFAGGKEANQTATAAPGVNPATEKQVWWLVRIGGWTSEQAQRLSKRQASAVIGKLKGES